MSAHNISMSEDDTEHDVPSHIERPVRDNEENPDYEEKDAIANTDQITENGTTYFFNAEHVADERDDGNVPDGEHDFTLYMDEDEIIDLRDWE